MIATTFRQSKIIRETVNIYGDKQYMTAVEEMAELMQAISKYLRINYSGCDDVSQIQKEAINNIAAERGRYTTGGEIKQNYEVRIDGKTNTLTTVQKDNNVCEPVRVGSYPRPNGELSTSQGFRIYGVSSKSITLSANGGGAGAKTGLYAILVEYKGEEPTKAISNTTGQTYTVYKVINGEITIKGRKYPIKLKDGYYIIRKLTVNECKRLQTVPEWYEFPVSDTQAYKMLGNGWTVDVIAHILKHIKENN